MRFKVFNFIFLSSLFYTFCICAQNNTDNRLLLRYDLPARVWEETLPLGNGRIGMMPDGGVEREHIVLNDISMWSGSTDSEAWNTDALQYLPKIRELLLKGDNASAQELMYQHFQCGGKGSALGKGKDAPYGCFQMLGDLYLNFRHSDKNPVKNYHRQLSLDDAVASVSYSKGGINYIREYFASHNDDVMVIHLKASQPKSISFDVQLSRPERGSVTIENASTLRMEGQLNDGHNGANGVRYLTRMQIINRNGKLLSKANGLSLEKVDEAWIIISSSTNLLDKDYKKTVDELLKKAGQKSYNKLLTSHIKAYQQKFDRVKLNLGAQRNDLTTEQRLVDFQKTGDPSFAALYFHFGRYLMISGTRENSLPLNLQGLWANNVQTPWNGDYHLNINVQMNYWPSEVCNLSELHNPLINLTKSLVASGEKTAKVFYGADGWVAHMMTNPWKFTAPGEHASWGATNTGGAWLCQHLWEHYEFSRDITYLKEIYPVLLGAAQFFTSSMISEPKHGWLVTAPSSSPENGFFVGNSDKPVYVCMGPTMDVQLVRELFTNTLAASRILKVEDNPTIFKIKQMLPKLPPMQISDKGYLQEWLEDYKEVEQHHRHVSHLYGLYPSNQISPNTTPALAAAARETLNRRGDGGTGWSRAWKVNFWARLHDGDRAYKLLKNLLQPVLYTDEKLANSGGTYPNLFCAHPPFQIDGNLGGTSGIAEMLVQSHEGYISLLPALPIEWRDGFFKGLRVRGGGEVSAYWKDGQLTNFTLKAHKPNSFRISLPQGCKNIRSSKKYIRKGELFQFDLEAGEYVDISL